MPVIPVGYAQITYEFGGTALPSGAAMTMGCAIDGSFSGPTAAAAARTALMANLGAYISSNVTLLSTTIKVGPTETGPFFTDSTSVAGTGSATTVPPNVAVLVNKVTASGGRKGRGRMFVPGIPEQDVNPNGTYATGVAAAWNTKLEDYRDDLIFAELIPVVLHNDATPPTAITALVLAPLVGTIKQRLRR